MYRLCKQEANVFRPLSCLVIHGQANGLRRVIYDQGQLAESSRAMSRGLQDRGAGKPESMEGPQASGSLPALGLERECRIFARYLTGQEPSRYIIEKYLDFHQKIGVRDGSTRFDRFLVSTASRGPYWTRMADSYGTLFRKNSVLREKLVVVLALSECAPPAFEGLDRVPGGGLAGAALRMAAGGMNYGLALLIGGMLFSPVRLWMALGKR